MERIDGMAAGGWSLGHPTDEPGVLYVSAPPLGALYEVDGRVLRVLRIVDARQLREPLW
ncbi:MAG: hypothetical protein WAM30_19630 [Candidatus Dormiibacterota bacterium]